MRCAVTEACMDGGGLGKPDFARDFAETARRCGRKMEAWTGSYYSYP